MASSATALASFSNLTISPKLPITQSPSASSSQSALRLPSQSLPSSLSSHRRLTFTDPNPKECSTFFTKYADTDSAVLEAEPETTDLVVSPAAEAATLVGKREEIFAVVMIGGRQYIVFPGRFIYTTRLKGANDNDKIILNKVLLVGTKTSTWIGKPVVQNATVHAVVEEQGLDNKVIVFKYKRKKNYRRNIGHRQPNTRIRITGITGYENSPFVTLDS